MRPQSWRLLTVAAALSLVAGCSKEAPKPLPDPLVEPYRIEDPRSVLSPGSSSPVATQTNAPTVVAQSSGVVESVLVNAGDRVVAGQALVRLDPIDARLADPSARVQIAAAAAQLARAEADFARYERLRQQNFISQAEFERRQAAVLAARAEHEAKLDGLGLITSRALAGGVIQRVSVSKGQRVEAGAVLMVVSGPASPVAQPLSSVDQRIRVPLSALINGGQAVMVIESIEGGHRVRLQPVTVASSDERWARVAKGLRDGDVVVSIGGHLLTDGQKVRVPVSAPNVK